MNASFPGVHANVLHKPAPILQGLFTHTKADDENERGDHAPFVERGEREDGEDGSDEEVEVGDAVELLVQAFGQECEHVVPGGGYVVGAVPKELGGEVEMRLVAVDDAGVAWSVDDVRALIVESFGSEASEGVEMAFPDP